LGQVPARYRFIHQPNPFIKRVECTWAIENGELHVKHDDGHIEVLRIILHSDAAKERTPSLGWRDGKWEFNYMKGTGEDVRGNKWTVEAKNLESDGNSSEDGGSGGLLWKEIRRTLKDRLDDQ
jgi:hypothetical protein